MRGGQSPAGVSPRQARSAGRVGSTAEAKPAGGGGYRSSLSQASTASREAVGVPRWSASTVT
jgi:hypothetical protein